MIIVTKEVNSILPKIVYFYFILFNRSTSSKYLVSYLFVHVLCSMYYTFRYLFLSILGTVMGIWVNNSQAPIYFSNGQCTFWRHLRQQWQAQNHTSSSWQQFPHVIIKTLSTELNKKIFLLAGNHKVIYSEV